MKARNDMKKSATRFLAAAVCAGLCLSACLAVGCSAGAADDAQGAAPVQQASPAPDAAKVKEGEPAPDFSFTVGYAGEGSGFTAGDAAHLADLRGKVVLVTFWATWCGYCVSDMPVWQELAEKYGDDLVVVTVNRGDDEKTAMSFAQDSGYPFVWTMESRETAASYPSQGIPFTVVVDKEGIAELVMTGTYRGDMVEYMDGIIAPLM